MGTTLNGKYRLERLIGVGGMAAVYRGSHRNGHKVAVKVLHASVSTHTDLRERFLREGYVANRVEHRGAVRVLDDDTAEDGSVFLVMELLEGVTLEASWERAGRRLPPREVSVLAHRLLDVLAAAHDQGVVHRDIKPENLFLTVDGILKVLDFGIARLRDATGGGLGSATRTGNMLGTPAYMPPEQALGRNREIDAQSDLWAVGATMFTLISGQYVHDAESVPEMLVYAGSRPARPLASVAPDTPTALAAVIDRALSFDKASRWASARAMQGHIETAHASSFGAAVPPERATEGGFLSSATAPPAGDAPRTPPIAPTRTLPTALQPRTTAPIAPSTPAALNISTTRGVESQGAPAATPRRSRRGTQLAIAALATLVVAVAGVAASMRRGDAPVPLESAAAAPSLTAAIEAKEPTPGPVIEHGTAAPVPSERPAGVEAGAAQIGRSNRAPTPAPRPAVTASAAGIDDEQHALDSVLSGLRAAKTVTPPATPVPAPAKPSCQPPYTIDSAGRRIPKPECL